MGIKSGLKKALDTLFNENILTGASAVVMPLSLLALSYADLSSSGKIIFSLMGISSTICLTARGVKELGPALHRADMEDRRSKEHVKSFLKIFILGSSLFVIMTGCMIVIGEKYIPAIETSATKLSEAAAECAS